MKTILVIEDEANIRVTIKDILEFNDYHVLVAKNGQEGFDLALENIPDLIICDVMMPVMNGFETLEAIRGNNITQNIPFVFLTAKADKQDFRQGMNIGADDFLTKPFQSREFLEVVKLRINKKESENSSFENEISVLKKDIKNLHNTFETLSYKNSHILRAPLLKIIGLIDFFTEELNESENPNKKEALAMLKDSCNELRNATVEIEKLIASKKL